MCYNKTMNNKMPLTPEVRAYFAELGRRSAEKIKAKYGNEYYKKLSAMRKNPGRKPKAKKEDIL